MGKKNSLKGTASDDSQPGAAENEEALAESEDAEDTEAAGNQGGEDTADSDQAPSENEAPKVEAPRPEEIESEAGQSSAPLNIQSRVTTAAALASAAPQHVSGSLNKVEILMGALKMALPSAIDAVDDELLRADLTLLLSLL